jgi:regulator of sigma E protease
MLEWFLGIAGLVLGFSALIFVHELGHFLLAKWHGVRVYVFSLGMGPYVLSFTFRGTCYVLSLIPLGGYVKMMGQDDLDPSGRPSQDKTDYRNKRPGQKAAILAAGAIFNLIFAFLAFMVCYWAGMYIEPPRVGKAPPDSPLAKAVLHPKSEGRLANLQPGDRLIEVNGAPVKTHLEAMLEIACAPRNEDLYLKVEGHIEPVVVTTRHDMSLGGTSIGLERYIIKERLPLGFTTDDRWFVAADPDARAETRGGPASQAGLQKGDIVLSVEDPKAPGGALKKEVHEFSDFTTLVRGCEGRALTLAIQRGEKQIVKQIEPIRKSDDSPYQVGVQLSARRRVDRIDPACEAYAAGLREGHYVAFFRPDDPNVQPWRSGVKGILVWSETPEGATRQAAITIPEETAGSLAFVQPHSAREWLSENLNGAIGMAWDDTVRFSGDVLRVLVRLFTGDVSVRNLSGPVGIGATIATVAANDTFMNYLWLLAFISLNLAVIQFVPIPLLDGFHLLLVALEKLKGSPVSMRAQEVCLKVGILIIGALLVLVFYNDIRRVFGL